MAVYMVDRELPGITIHQLVAAQKTAIETCRQFTAEGKPVSYIRSAFVPSDSNCRCLFEAPNAELVEELNKAAYLPFVRVVEAMDLSP